MTDEQQQEFNERLIKVLERIAYALELANFNKQAWTTSVPTTPPPVTYPTNGYQCARCGTWILPGSGFHACGGSLGLSGGGTSLKCGGGCWLNTGHEGSCQHVTVT